MRTTTPIKAPWLSERVLQMEKNFMDLHYQGFSIPDIAKKFNIHKTTIYYHLQDIAEANGTTREELLKGVNTSSKTHIRREEAAFKVDAEKLLEDLENAKNSVSEAQQKIKQIIASFEEE